MKIYRKNIFTEVFISYFILALINYQFFPSDPGFIHLAVSPYWAIILLAAFRYGFGAGLVSGLIATMIYLYFSLDGVLSKTALEQLAESKGLVLPVLFIFVGAFLGEIRQRDLLHEKETKKRLIEKDADIKKMKERVDALEKARRILESRIVGETSTLRTLHKTAQKFESLNQETIYQGFLETLGEHFKVEKAALYLLEDDLLVLRAEIGHKGGESVERKLSVTDSILSLALKKERMLNVKDLLVMPEANAFQDQFGSLLCMVPFKSGDKILGVVSIEQMDFMSFNDANLDLMNLVIDWAGQACGNAEKMTAYRLSSVWDQDLHIYSYRHFLDSINLEIQRAQTYQLTLSLAFIKLTQFASLLDQHKPIILKALIAIAKRHLAETDFLYKYKFEGVFAILAPMKTEEQMKASLQNIETDFAEQLKHSSVEMQKIQVRYGITEWQHDRDTQESFLKRGLVQCRLPT